MFWHGAPNAFPLLRAAAAAAAGLHMRYSVRRADKENALEGHPKRSHQQQMSLVNLRHVLTKNSITLHRYKLKYIGERQGKEIFSFQ